MKIEHITDITDNKEYINIYVNKSTSHESLQPNHEISVTQFSHEISVTFVKDNDNLIFDSAWHRGVSEMAWVASEEESFENTFPGLLTKLRTEIKKDEDKNQSTTENQPDNLLWNALLNHRGHKVSIVSYGDWNDPADVCLECEDCGEVILDAELYTLQTRNSE